MAGAPLPAAQRTGLDDARDRGRHTLEELGAIAAGQDLSPWERSACLALGRLRDNSPQEERGGAFEIILTLALTRAMDRLERAIDDHTNNMGALAEKLNRFTLGLAIATVALVLVSVVQAFIAWQALKAPPPPAPVVNVPAPIVNVQPAITLSAPPTLTPKGSPAPTKSPK